MVCTTRINALALVASVLGLFLPLTNAACDASTEPWQGVFHDIGQKITAAEGPSGGSTYVVGADGAGVHLFADANLLTESSDNSFSAHTAVHEYLHILQQAMLAGDVTNTSIGPVPIKATSTSTARFACINKCASAAVFCEKSLAVLNALPDSLKLLDRTVFVIFYPHTEVGNVACTNTDAKKQEILDEVYAGADGTCANGVQLSYNYMLNENHLVAEGDAEYWGLTLTDDTNVFSVFDGAAYWSGKITDGKTSCGVPGDTKFRVESGSSSATDSLVNAYSDAEQPQCADNPIGEISYAFFLEWCATHSITCTQDKQFSVWMRARAVGWCPAFKETYGKSWGEYVCAMEASDEYNSNPSCVATDVACIACTGEGCESAADSDSSSAGNARNGGWLSLALGAAVLLA